MKYRKGHLFRGQIADYTIQKAIKEGAYGQTYKEQRFSTLTQINRENVRDVGLAWHKAIGGARERMQGTPLIVDGVLFATNGWSARAWATARKTEHPWPASESP